jgi:dihydrofolate reductase
MINIIAAMSKNRVIGNKGNIPWKIPNDTEFFRKTTKFCPVVMGRKTFESIGRLLPERKNIILTRDINYKREGCFVYHDISKVIDDFGKENLMVIGGEEVYKLFFPYTDRIYLTYIDQDFEGDTFFPDFEDGKWVKESEEKGIKNEENPYDYYFQTFVKKNGE